MMMDAIVELKNRLIEVKSKLPEITIEVAKRNEAEAVYLVTEEQLSGQGINSNAQPILPKYTPFTVRIKRQKGQESGFVTWKDTGRLHDSVKLIFGTAQTPWLFSVTATDSKFPKLSAKYGNDVLGLTPESLEKYNAAIKDELVAEVQKLIL